MTRSKRQKIIEIANQLVKCDYKCKGVINDKVLGIIPRGLIYEHEGRDSKRPGVIIIGINPGKSNQDERDFYQNNNQDYAACYKIWKDRNFQYHKKARELLTNLGFKGDIVWTDLAKCECDNRGRVPLQTLRVCIDHFLEKEIRAVGQNFTIIALGNIAFDFCALRFPKRLVIGLPHPTGAWALFNELRRDAKLNKLKYLKILNKCKAPGFHKAIKLSDWLEGDKNII